MADKEPWCDVCGKRKARVYKDKLLLCTPCSGNETNGESYKQVFYGQKKGLTPREPERKFFRSVSNKRCPKCGSVMHVMCGPALRRR